MRKGKAPRKDKTKAKARTTKPTYRRTQYWDIAKIDPGTRYRKHPEDGLDSLVKSIRKVGLLHPPVVTEKGLLVVGLRRLEAYKKLGRTKIPVRVVANIGDGLLTAERDEDVERKNLNASEAAALASAIGPAIRKEAKKRQRGARKAKNKVGISHQSAKGKARDEIAKATGRSPRTMAKIEAIIDSGRKALINEMNKTDKVDGVYKKLRSKVQTLSDRVHAAYTALNRLKPELLTVTGLLIDGKDADAEAVTSFAKLLCTVGILGRNLSAARNTTPSPTKEGRKS